MTGIKEYFISRKKDKELQSAYNRSAEALHALDKLCNSSLQPPSEAEKNRVISVTKKAQQTLHSKRASIKLEMLQAYDATFTEEFKALTAMPVNDIHDCHSFFVAYHNIQTELKRFHTHLWMRCQSMIYMTVIVFLLLITIYKQSLRGFILIYG